MPKTDGPHEWECKELERIHIITMIVIFVPLLTIGIVASDIRHKEHEALQHPCLISDNGKIAIIDNGYCANSHSNTQTEIEYFKDKEYTITAADEDKIYMEKQNGFRAFN